MYAKLMSRITESSLMEERVEVRYCFMMMLAIADPHGYVVGTDVAIARRMNVPLEVFQSCIAELMKPDSNSNSKEHEGRRVILSDCERGYHLVNYTKYRDTRDEEQRREYMREYMRKRRSANGVAHVNPGKQKLAGLAQAEADEEAIVPPTPLSQPDASPAASRPAGKRLAADLEEKAIAAVHTAIQDASQRKSTLNPDTRKLIKKFIDAGFTASDYALVARFIRHRNKLASEKKYVVSIGNGLIERLSKFEDRLTEAKGWERNLPKQETAKDRALASIGRPVKRPESEPLTGAQLVEQMGLIKQNLHQQGQAL